MKTFIIIVKRSIKNSRMLQKTRKIINKAMQNLVKRNNENESKFLRRGALLLWITKIEMKEVKRGKNLVYYLFYCVFLLKTLNIKILLCLLTVFRSFKSHKDFHRIEVFLFFGEF